MEIMKYKAKIKGYDILIPKIGNGPMLFLEWLRDNNHTNGLLYKMWRDEDENYFSARLSRHPSATADSCVAYINANL